MTAAPDTLVATWTRTRNILRDAGAASPALDARLLVEAAAGVTRLDIVTDPYRVVPADAQAALDALVARRAAREPLAYILGRRDFWSFTLAVTPAVLTPRPETEILVDAALPALPAEGQARVLDLGVGSGAILLALLSERPGAVGVGVDRSAEALDVARANATALGLDARAVFRAGDWGASETGPFDLIVSNPPYIPTAEIDGLMPEVSVHEPRLALDGGADGLEAYRRIAPDLARLLARGGRFALEVGRGQAVPVMAILRGAGLEPDAVRPDLSGAPRVIVGRQAA